MKYFIIDAKNDSLKIFYNFILIYFFINLITSISLTLSIFSVYQGLISIFIVYIFGFYLIFKNKIDKNYKYFFLIIILFSVLFWIFAFYPALNTNDDFRAYLIFIEKTASEGSLSVDPFSSRRMYSLGGLYPFQGSLSNIDLKFLSFIEPALGIFLTSIAIFFFNKDSDLKLLCMVILFLSPLLGSKVLANTGGVFILVFLSYTIISTYSLSIKNDENLGKFYLIIVLLCTVLSLTIKPIPLIFNSLIILFLLINFYKYKKNFVKYISIFITLIFCLIYLYPFLRASYESSGTLLYPILGDGWRLPSQYSPQRFDNFLNIKNPTELKDFLLIPLKDIFFIISVSGIFLLIRNKEFFLKLSLLISYLTFYLIIVFTVGDDINLVKRYSFTISFSIILYLISFHLKNNFQVKSKKKIFNILSSFLILTLLLAWFSKGTEINSNRKKVSDSFKNLSNKEDLDKISYLKKKKILISSKQAINLYKNDFKDLIVFDVPFQTFPWEKEKKNLDKLNYDRNIIIENFYDYLKQEDINYIITDKSYSENDIISNSLFGEFLKNKSNTFKHKNFTLHKINF